MVRFINSLTGTEMFVADDRKEEYLAAGHRLAVEVPAKAEEPKTVKAETKKTPSKAPVRKSASRKK